jgi:hypothetical protein
MNNEQGLAYGLRLKAYGLKLTAIKLIAYSLQTGGDDDE